MSTPMAALSGVSSALSITNSIINLTAPMQAFPSLADIVQAVAREIERAVKAVYKSDLHEIGAWIQAYSTDMREHIMDFQSAGWTPSQLFERLVEDKKEYFIGANRLANQLAELIRDEDSGVDISSKALLMYLTLQTFLIGMHKEIIRVAKLAVDHPKAAPEATSQQLYAVDSAKAATATATELLQIIAARRQQMVTPTTREIPGGSTLEFYISDTYLDPDAGNYILMFHGTPSDSDFGRRVVVRYRESMVGVGGAGPEGCLSRAVQEFASYGGPHSHDGSRWQTDPNLERSWKVGERILGSAGWYQDARKVLGDLANMAVVVPPSPVEVPIVPLDPNAKNRNFIVTHVVPSVSNFDRDAILHALAGASEADCLIFDHGARFTSPTTPNPNATGFRAVYGDTYVGDMEWEFVGAADVWNLVLPPRENEI